MATKKGDIGQMNLIQKLKTMGYINDQHLDVAIKENKQTGELVTQILVKRGFITEDDLTAVMCAELGKHHINLAKKEVSQDAIALFTGDFVREYKCLPIEVQNGKLTVVISNPYDVKAEDAISERVYNGDFPGIMEVEFVVSTESKVNKAIEKYYEKKDRQEAIAAIDLSIEAAIKHSIEEIAAMKSEEEAQQPIQKLTDQLLILGVTWGASDIHICPEENHVRTRYRVDGILVAGPSIPKQLQDAVISRIKIISKLNISERRAPQDGRVNFKREEAGVNVDLRVSIIPITHGENIVLRILDKAKLVSLEQLGFADEIYKKVQEIMEKTFGLFLVTGPTGSGKSTTLYSMLQAMDALQDNIITLEDPVEYQLPFIRQSQVNKSVDYDFASGLRAFLRHDPDVILVGEIRDHETAEIAVHSAQTGHLVFSTLHTNTAVNSLSRLAYMGIDLFLLSAVLEGVLAQRLMRRVCSNCKEQYPITERENFFLRFPPDTKLVRGRGCPKCKNKGYAGRMGLHELFAPDEEIRTLIVKNTPEIEIKKAAKAKDMKFFYEDGREKVWRGYTNLDELLRVLPPSEH